MLTILTPAYNRAYILGQLYESLKRQTSMEFMWLVIDDDSTDDTGRLVKEWAALDNGFEIQYMKKEHGGKHRALNYAMPYVRTEYVFIVDSDDYLVDCAVEKICQWLQSISKYTGFAGVAGLRGGGKPVQPIGEFPQKYKKRGFVDAVNRERRKMHLGGDKAEVYRTKLLRRHPFPEFRNEMFLSECVVWNAISDRGYKLRWFSEIIMITAYREDGLTHNLSKNRLECFRGYTAEIKSEMKTGGLFRYRVIGRYMQTADKKGLHAWEIRKQLGISPGEYTLAKSISWLQSAADLFRQAVRIKGRKIYGQTKKHGDRFPAHGSSSGQCPGI